MTGFGLFITVLIALWLYASPRSWAALPLLLGAIFVPMALVIEAGPLHFTIVRILVAIGFLRMMARGERIVGELGTLDWVLILWAVWTLGSSVFHEAGCFVTRAGEMFSQLGCYFLFRVFLQEEADIRRLFKVICVLFVPLAAAMAVERLTGKNCFTIVFGLSEEVVFRHGHYRAHGPFAHAIMAGTVGAVCVPMALYWWYEKRWLAVMGLAATGIVVLASGSSGPVMTVVAVGFALALWRFRSRLRIFRWLVLFLIIVLNAVMNAPVYYLISYIDITGGSTGWHRAALINTAIAHFSEWWLAGTDVTRHWMPTGVVWNEKQTDITNYYIVMGVTGGVLLLLLFCGVLCSGFAAVGNALRRKQESSFEQQFLIWTLGAMLFGHAVAFVSAAYYDQSTVFLSLLLAAIGSLAAMPPIQGPIEAGESAWSATE